MTRSRKNSPSLPSDSGEEPSHPRDTRSLDRTESQRIEFLRGGKRDDRQRLVAYHLLCPAALEQYAQTAKEGEIKYGPRNWEKGIPTENYIDHALEHLNATMRAGFGHSKIERLINLGHAMWNV